MIIIIIAGTASRRRTTEVELLDERAGWNSQRNDELNYQVQQYHPLEHIYRQFVRIHGRVQVPQIYMYLQGNRILRLSLPLG